MNQIKMMDINELYPHPDNPRKNLGDISELAESIKKNGIMQNLTVVPGHYLTLDEYKNQYAAVGGNKRDAEVFYQTNRESAFVGDGYTVIIGHRRLAASKAAGLDKVPCVISDMDERQQLCTMMEENMQRQDLTITEQAYGFQFMLDLGEDIKSIAKRTGFGETTIRHRLEIAKLDRKALEANLKGTDGGYQLGINDLIELEKIKDVKKRNDILKTAYSQADLQAKIKNAVNKEKIDAAMEELIPLMDSMGVKECPKSIDVWNPGVSVVQRIDLEKKVPKEICLKEKEGAKYYWKIDYYNIQPQIIEKAPKQDKAETEEARRAAEREQRKSELCELEKNIYNTIEGQLKLVDEGKVKLRDGIDETTACARIWEIFVRNENTLYFYEIAAFRSGRKTWEITEKEKEEYIEGFLLRKQLMQMMIMLLMEMRFKPELHDWEGKYKPVIAAKVKRVSDLLIDFYGFGELPPKLQEVLDGTHELYKKDEAADE